MKTNQSVVESSGMSNPSEDKLSLMPHTPRWQRLQPKVQSINMTLAVARRDRNGLSILVLTPDHMNELIVRYDPFHNN